MDAMVQQVRVVNNKSFAYHSTGQHENGIQAYGPEWMKGYRRKEERQGMEGETKHKNA